jgi:hypothetical protein
MRNWEICSKEQVQGLRLMARAPNLEIEFRDGSLREVINSTRGSYIKQQIGDFSGAVNAFSDMQKRFHMKANSAKNAALYVDFVDGQFVAPNERITPQMVAEAATLNEEFLG